LPKIDFKEVQSTLEKVFRKTGNDGCAVIFLLQKSMSFGGEHCATRVRDLLEQRTADLKHWRLQFSVGVGRGDECGLLNGLADYLNLPAEDRDLPRYTQQ